MKHAALAFVCFAMGCEARASDVRQKASAVANPTGEQPDLRLVVITNLSGTLEPCGCKSEPRGGVAKLRRAIADARAGSVPSLLLFAGDTFFGVPTVDAMSQRPLQDFWKAEAIASILDGSNVTAVAPGVRDLSAGRKSLSDIARASRFPLVSAGGVFAESESSAFADGQQASTLLDALVDTTIADAGRERVGLVAVTANASSPDFRTPTDPGRLLEAKAASLRSAGAALVVALVAGYEDDVRSLSAVPGLSLVVSGGRPDERPYVEQADGSAPVLHAGQNGEGVLVADLWIDDPAQAFAISAKASGATDGPVPGNRLVWSYRELGANAPADATVAEAVARFHAKVNEFNRAAYAGVAPVLARDGEPEYVGSRPCAACHTAAYLWWAKTPHARAYETLEREDKEYNLECVSCHVTGYGKAGGATVARVGALRGVGCESCHGPGSAHVEDSRPPYKSITRSVARAMCLECHTRQHSDSFEYGKFRGELLVPGHGRPLTAGAPPPHFRNSNHVFR